jgi:SAM-dependent methyltransferase
MKLDLLNYLVCPECKTSLRCAATYSEQDEIIEGVLQCLGCGREYAIRRGVPYMVRQELQSDKRQTADAFGWEWQEFRELHSSEEVYREQFLDWVYPIQPEFSRGKVVLDAGCGMGRFTQVTANFGAAAVIGVDLSEAVDVAFERTRNLPNAHIVKGDIYNLPFNRPFDFIFSIGVIHHLPDPEGGFHTLTKHLNERGSIFAWVYGYENNGWIRKVADPIRINFSSRLPRRALYAISMLITIILQPVLKGVYLPAARTDKLKWLRKVLPYQSYLSWLAQFGFRHNHHVVFDHMVAPTAFYIKRRDFAKWFTRAGFREVAISCRNGNSWRGFGQRRLQPANSNG